GLGLRDSTLCLIDCCLEWPRIDGEETVALFHDLAVGEVDRLQVTRYSGPNLYVIDGNKPPDIFVVVRDKPLRRLRDRNLRRRWRRSRGLAGLLFPAASQWQCEQ